MSHLFIHVFDVNEASYLRVVAYKDVVSFKNDMTLAYGNDVRYDDLKVYYNCGVFLDRIIKEIDETKKHETIAKGVYKLQDNHTAIDRLIEKYLDYVCELEHNMYSGLEDQDWSAIRILEYQHDDVDKQFIYLLRNYDITEDGNVVITREIASSMVLTLYMSEYWVFGIDEIEAEEDDTVTYTPLLQGYAIDKNKVTIAEIKHILSILGIIDTRKVIASANFQKVFEAINKIEAANEYSSRYAYINDDDPLFSQLNTNIYSDYLSVYDDSHIHKNIELYKERNLENRKKSSENVTCEFLLPEPPIVLNHVKNKPNVYKSAITNKIIQTEEDFGSLKEFIHIDNLQMESDLSKSIFASLIDKEICKKDIDEVLQMITTLANIYQDKQQLPHKLELENTIEAALSFEIQQNSLTRRYAIENKDDNSHTMASIVTDNVIKTLSQHMSKEHINRNMISRDIVSAGIKKIRKANGFFYGIKDTSKCT